MSVHPAAPPGNEILSSPAAASPRSAAFDPSRSFSQLQRDLFALSAVLLLMVVGVKAALLPFEVHTFGEFVRWILRLAIVGSADVAFVALSAAGAWAVSLACSRRSWLVRIWRPVMFTAFYVAGAYGIFSYGFYGATLQPFTVRMLTFVGGPSLMLSSVQSYLTAPMVALLIVVPVLLTAVPILMRRLPAPKLQPRATMVAACAASALLLAYTGVCQAYIGRNWTEPKRWERRISCSPHLELATSCLEELTKSESWTLTMNTGAYDDVDFVSRERDPSAPPALTLPDLQLAGPRPKNVVVFFCESMANEYLSVYGNPQPTTPHLKKLAEEKGVVFENFYVSTPYSCKSLIALTAGVYPRTDWKLIVSQPEGFDVPLINQVLEDRGYRSCYAHSGYWSWHNRDRYLRPRGKPTIIDAENLSADLISSWGVGDQAMFGSCLEWIDAAPEQPFFLVAYTLETHHPYATPNSPHTFDVPTDDQNDYFNAIRATDERIVEFMEQLEKRGLLDDTLVVVTADHGEAFGQHNQKSHNFGVYQPNVNIPLILFHPSLANMGKRQKQVREQIDLPATILELIGAPTPNVWQGRNLFRPDDGRPAYFFCVGNKVVLGLRDGDLKYHYHVNEGLEELFDVVHDPGELKNIARRHPEACQEYRRRVAGFVRYQRQFLTDHGSP